jgi:hypothetical protein
VWRESPDDDPRTVDHQAQRSSQRARRAFEWVEAGRVALATGKPVVTPKLAAHKSARRAWQRANQKQQQEGQQPAASAAPPASSRRSSSVRTRSGNSKSHMERTPSGDLHSRRGSAWDEGFVGLPTKVDARDEFEGFAACSTKGLSARRQINTPGYSIIDDWPKHIDIYSHDSKTECCWYKYCVDDVKQRCLRVDCRKLYDPYNHSHDGRHQDVQAGLLQYKEGAVVINMCTEVRKHLRANAGKRCCIAFWCNRGKHRSVGCAELFTAILSTEPWARAAAGQNGCPIYIEHISLAEHNHGCRSRCRDCCAKSPFLNQHLLAARALWDRTKP